MPGKTTRFVCGAGRRKSGRPARTNRLLPLVLALTTALPQPPQADEIERSGDIAQIALPLTALGLTFTAWGTTHAKDDPAGRWQLYKSLGATLLTVHALKYAVDEKRPGSEAHNSFPSGHTAAAFSGASFIQRRYGWALGAPAYGLATFVGYSRVHARAHYVHDTVAGAAIAIGFTYLFTEPRGAVKIAPMVGTNRTGLRIMGRF